MQKRGFFLIGIVFSLCVFGEGVGVLAFSPKPPPILKISASQPSNTFRGSVDEVGRGFIVVNGQRFTVAADVRVTNEEDGILERGLNALRQRMKVELTLEGQTVVRIKVFGLLMR